MLEGDLGDFTLPEILNLLAFTSKTGRLAISSDTSQGRVEFVEGRVCDASADAKRLPLARRLLGRGLIDAQTLSVTLYGRDVLPTDLEFARELIARDHVPSDRLAEVLREQTLDAVFDLLRWTSGSFRFERGATEAGSDAPPALAATVEELLGEAQSRLDAWDDVQRRTGPGDAVVGIGRPPDVSVAVDADGWQLIGLADGIRTIDDLAVLTGRGAFETRSTLAGLVDLGVVRIGTQGADGGVDQLLAAQEVLARAERSLRGDDAGADDTPDATPAPDLADPDLADPGPDDEDDPIAALHDLELEVPARPVSSLNGVGLGTSPLRGDARRDRLRTDPTVDADLVSRLIDGVERL